MLTARETKKTIAALLASLNLNEQESKRAASVVECAFHCQLLSREKASATISVIKAAWTENVKWKPKPHGKYCDECRFCVCGCGTRSGLKAAVHRDWDRTLPKQFINAELDAYKRRAEARNLREQTKRALKMAAELNRSEHPGYINHFIACGYCNLFVHVFNGRLSERRACLEAAVGEVVPHPFRTKCTCETCKRQQKERRNQQIALAKLAAQGREYGNHS